MYTISWDFLGSYLQHITFAGVHLKFRIMAIFSLHKYDISQSKSRLFLLIPIADKTLMNGDFVNSSYPKILSKSLFVYNQPYIHV